VYISDINDNPPVFSASSPLRLSVSESTVPGDPMATFQLPIATDADGPANSVVGYQLQPETNSSPDYFRLSVMNSSASELTEVRLRLVRSLDRETLSEHRLILVAYDSGLPPLSSSLLIVIEVGDANDNRPVFDRREYDVTLPETAEVGTEVAVLRAVDADAGANGRVRYRFSGRGRGRQDFRLFERSGVVVVARRLGFSRQSVYRLGVLAEDEGVGGLASFAMLTVRLRDENDHSPVINVHAAANEDGGGVTVNVLRREPAAAVDRFVAHLSVSDNDGGDNGRVKCWLDTSPAVDVTDQPITEEPRTSASFTRRSESDRNMSAVFELVSMFENEYKIQLTTNITMIQDDITEVGYHLTVTCRDHGFPVSMTSSVAIDVTIHYENIVSGSVEPATAAANVPPRFEFPIPGNDTVYISAGLPVGHVIAIVRATYGSGDLALSYESVDGNGSAYFDVGRTSGHVTVARPLSGVDNATLKLIIGVSGASSDDNISMFALAELCVVVTLPVATTVTSYGSESDWQVWLMGQNWSGIAFILVISCSLVLGSVLFAAIFLVCRKSLRGKWTPTRRSERNGRKLTSSYHVAVEFTADDDGLNNVAMATNRRAPVIGSVT